MNYLNTRARRVIAGLALLLIVVTGVGVAFGVRGNEKGQQQNNNQVVTPTLKSQVNDWYNGVGYTDLQTVENDLSQFSSDAQANDVIASENDGSQLVFDAQQAADNPPPIQAQQYTTAMDTIEAAGNDASVGDFTDATTELNTATTQITNLSNYINSLNGLFVDEPIRRRHIRADTTAL